MKSIKARKQRKSSFNAPLHKKRKWLASHLHEDLLLKYDRRRIPLVKGDTVRVMRGTFKDHEDKVNSIHLKKQLANVEGVVITKADGKKVAKPIHPSNLLITKLNLTDSWRRRILEKDLSEDTRKEIEKEATEQIKEMEEEKRKAEELAAAEEEEEEIAEEEIEEPEPSVEKGEEEIAEDEIEEPEPSDEEEEIQKEDETEPQQDQPAEKQIEDKKEKQGTDESTSATEKTKTATSSDETDEKKKEEDTP